MWRVVYADGVKDQNEEYLVRKVAVTPCPTTTLYRGEHVEKEAK